MLKILLVYDDFQELTAVELMLKKIGFDVVGVTSEFSLAEQLLSFNPQVVVAQGRSAKVSTGNVGRRLRESVRWDGQSVLIFFPQSKPQPQDLLKIRMDVGLEYPVEPTKLVQVLAQLGNLDANQLLDKLIKSMAQEEAAQDSTSQNLSSPSQQQSIYVGGGQADSAHNTSISGNANNEVSQNLKNNSANDPLANTQTDTPKPPPSSQKAGEPPLFPLSARDQNNPFGVNGASPSPDDPFGINGQFPLNPFQGNPTVQDPLMQELENLLQKKSDLSITPPIQDPARHRKYDEYMKTIPIQELSSIKKREAKSRLRDLIKDMDQAEFKNQDGLRREFVKALFKKDE